MPNDPAALALRRPSLSATFGAALPGVALACGVAAVAVLARRLPGLGLFSPLILALTLGVLIGNLVELSARFRPGITFAMRHMLRVAVALLGLQLTVAQVGAVGVSGMAVIAVTLVATFLVTEWLGRRLGVAPDLTRLIATGTSICGASAVIAANGVTRARDEDVAYAIATVTIFGSLSMLLYPVLEGALRLAPHAYGLWAGASIHEVAQVVGAGFAAGADSGQVATISKLARVLLLAPMIVAMTWSARRTVGDAADRPPLVPWFVGAFVLLMGLNSLAVIPEAARAPLVEGTPVLLAVALAAMGLETRLDRLRSRGVRPLLVGAGAWLFISVFSLSLITLTAS